MKNRNYRNWLVAALIALGITIASESTLNANTTGCNQICSTVSKSNTKHEDLSADWFLRDPKELVCSKEPASYEFQDWFDWTPKVMNRYRDMEMASYTSSSINRQPAQSTN